MVDTNNLKKYKSIPVYIVEDHDVALTHIYRNIGSKHLPFTNNYMIHFDSHPDLSIPRSMKGSVAKSKYEIFDAVSIESWILPAAYAGYINRIVWIKPHWSNQMPEGKHKFNIGEDEMGHVAVDCPLDYYVSEGVYCNKLAGDVRSVELDVMQLDCDASLVKNEDIYILDIDLDYFSTYNPFKVMYSKGGVYEELQKIFIYNKPDLNSIEQIAETVRSRTNLLNELEQLFEHLDKFRNLDNYEGLKTSNYDKIVDFRNYVLNHYHNEEIDWKIMFNAGCTWDDPEFVLPHHETDEEELNEMFSNFDHFVSSLPVPPIIITIARSSEDCYCPPHQVEKIQTTVLNILEKYFKVDILLDYMNACD